MTAFRLSILLRRPRETCAAFFLWLVRGIRGFHDVDRSSAPPAFSPSVSTSTNFNNYQDLRQIEHYGTLSNPHIWVMREFVNSQANHLGSPLPKGRVRFYRRDADGQVEFTGENEIDHTSKDETVRVYTGNAFDIAGERRQTKFESQIQSGGFLDESFEIKLRNHKKEPATVRVVEHLYRWTNWVITQESAAHKQTDSKTIEYEVALQSDEERILTYTAHYTW